MADVHLSVVTAVRVTNEESAAWLNECLASVRDRAGNVEHIVVDDGSLAPQADVFRARYPAVRWLRNETAVGPGAARNLGIRAARGRYIFPLDGDDRLCEGAVERLYEARCDEGFVYGQLYGFSADKPEPALMRHNYNYTYDSLREMTGPIGINALYPRSMWAAVGGYRENMAGLEDIEFWIRCAERGYCGAFHPFPMIEYRQHGASRTASIYGTGEVRNIRARMEEWHAPFFGGTVMPCRKCPQGQVQIQIFQGGPEPTPEGFVPMKYIGPKMGSFNTARTPSGNYYRVNGRGSWINVYPADVDFLLSLRYGGEPEVQRQLATVQPVSVLPDKYTPAPIPDAAPVEDIAMLGQTEAMDKIEATDDPDTLRVWMAMEKAREKTRPKVVGALRKKMGASGDVA